MKRTYYIFCGLLLAVFFSACRKYVEEVPVQNLRTLTTTNDYRLLTNNTSNIEASGYSFPVISGDDVYFTDTSYQNSYSTYYIPVYTWTGIYFNTTQSDLNWEGPYSKIYVFNAVVSGVMASTGAADSVKREIMAEALVHRAFSYWSLVNGYGKQFDSSSASTDPGVPLLTAPDLYANLTRASVQKVYDQVISDCKTAIPYLPALAAFDVYPSRAAAYALLSRVFLFTRNFPAASAYADSAIALKGNITDYNTYISGTTMKIPLRVNDQEIILSKLQNGLFIPEQLNPSLVALMDTADLRYKLFTRSGTAYSSTWQASTRIYWRYWNYNFEGNNIGLTTPEVYLIKAECLARAGNTSGSLTLLNQLRQKRYAPARFTALTAPTADSALSLVVRERKLEFFGRGFEWFDQKRLNKDAAFARTVTRVFQGTTYTLAPNSNAYVYPIGQKYIALNPEITQNP